VKRRTKISLVVVTFVGLCGISLWLLCRVLIEDHGVGVDSVSWLPPEARNITYIRNDAIALAEFDIEQQVFEEWCSSKKMPLRKLGSGERHLVMRAVALLAQRGIVPTSTSPSQVGEGWHKHFRAGDLFYEKRWRNGGGYTIGYDSQAKRGYYRYDHH